MPRDDETWGLERGGKVAWLPTAVAKAVWGDEPALLRGELASALMSLGFLERSKGNRGPDEWDRNEVFASALCEERGSRALAELAERHYVVVGCGGLGTSTAIQLAALGARRFTLIDADRVERSNLNRLLWAGPAEIGKLKVGALAERLRMRFGVDANAVSYHATRGSLNQLYGPDGPGPATWLLTVDQALAARETASWLHGRHDAHYVHAGYFGSRCVAGPFVADAADPCPFCGSGSPHAPTEGFVAPSAAPNNLLIASFLAAQLLMVAGAGAGDSMLRGARWVLDLRTGEVDVTRMNKQQGCEVCQVDR